MYIIEVGDALTGRYLYTIPADMGGMSLFGDILLLLHREADIRL